MQSEKLTQRTERLLNRDYRLLCDGAVLGLSLPFTLEDVDAMVLAERLLECPDDDAAEIFWRRQVRRREDLCNVCYKNLGRMLGQLGETLGMNLESIGAYADSIIERQAQFKNR